jgi:hypothetical protein
MPSIGNQQTTDRKRNFTFKLRSSVRLYRRLYTDFVPSPGGCR